LLDDGIEQLTPTVAPIGAAKGEELFPAGSSAMKRFPDPVRRTILDISSMTARRCGAGLIDLCLF
jgi:hypothetical protein